MSLSATAVDLAVAVVVVVVAGNETSVLHSHHGRVTPLLVV